MLVFIISFKVIGFDVFLFFINLNVMSCDVYLLNMLVIDFYLF